MTQAKMKELVVIAFKNEYGFAPNEKDIVELEAEEGRDEIRLEFEVKGHAYEVKIHIDWVANNSETKARKYYCFRGCEINQIFNPCKD